jgi:hypothetical protein
LFWLLMDEFTMKIWPANVSRNMGYGRVSYLAILYQLQQALDSNPARYFVMSCQRNLREQVVLVSKFGSSCGVVFLTPLPSAAASLSWLPARILHYGCKSPLQFVTQHHGWSQPSESCRLLR